MDGWTNYSGTEDKLTSTGDVATRYQEAYVEEGSGGEGFVYIATESERKLPMSSGERNSDLTPGDPYTSGVFYLAIPAGGAE